LIAPRSRYLERVLKLRTGVQPRSSAMSIFLIVIIEELLVAKT